jgi:hypothetical protein
MTKRIIDQFGQVKLSKTELLESIKLAEGRTMVSEIICPQTPMLYDISNPELATGFGADIVLLNMYDVEAPFIAGITTSPTHSPIHIAKKLTGGFYGVNLEPVDPSLRVEDLKTIPPGRTATVKNVGKLIEQGADMVVLTGNPNVGVSHQSLVACIKTIKAAHGDDILVIAGRMHAAGDSNAIGRNLIDEDKMLELIKVGVDIVLLPAPGTIPGLSKELISQYIHTCHQHHKLVMTTIGTSQEGADSDTIKRIAFYAKEAGSDLHHIGDCGYGPGIAVPENIMTYSIVIKGRRHTYRRMAGSINR